MLAQMPDSLSRLTFNAQILNGHPHLEILTLFCAQQLLSSQMHAFVYSNRPTSCFYSDRFAIELNHIYKNRRFNMLQPSKKISRYVLALTKAIIIMTWQ
jgi:hypothetical protein